MIYGYELIKLFSDEEKDKKNSSALATAGAGAAGLLGGALASGSISNAKAYKASGDQLKKGLKDLHASNRNLVEFKKSGVLKAAQKEVVDLKTQRWNSIFKKEGEDSLLYNNAAAEIDRARGVDPTEIKRRKKVASDFNQKILAAEDRLNTAVRHGCNLETAVADNLDKAKDLRKEHIMHKKNLVKSLGKAAIVGGLAAGGVAAYNHFKNKDKNSK